MSAVCLYQKTCGRLTSMIPQQMEVVVAKGLQSKDKFVAKGEPEFNLVRQMLNSNLPPHEKTPYRVMRESTSVVLAGTETTGSALTVTMYHLLAQPEKTARLRKEIEEVHNIHGRPPTYLELKELPYLVSGARKCVCICTKP